MRRRIKINFADCWDGPKHDYRQDPIYRFLCRHYEVEISDKPEYLFCEVLGHDDLKYDCVKIVTTGENMVPDFSRYDYVMGFDYIEFGDRYLRSPLYIRYGEYEKLKGEGEKPDPQRLLDRKFCSFVVSNLDADPMREKFFRELSKYKKVDSGGRYLNNVGGPVKNKLEFCARYKFNIAIENSAYPGYVTEKVMQPLTVHSVPIYYGDPLIHNDFTPECMVRIRSKDDIERAIEEIIALDRDDERYLQKCLAPRLVKPWDYYERQREEFLLHIIEQPLAQARRTVDYGYQAWTRSQLRRLYRLSDLLHSPLRTLKSLRHLLPR